MEEKLTHSRKRRLSCRFLAFLLCACLLVLGIIAILHFTQAVNIPFLRSQGASATSSNNNGIEKGVGNNGTIGERPAKGPRVQEFLKQRLVPPKEGTLFGAWLFGDKYYWVPSPEEFNSGIGYNASVIGVFVDDSSTTFVQTLQSAADAAQRTGAILVVGWEPFGGLNSVTDAYVNRMVSMLKGINDRGIPIMLRWAHEMNGGWYAWGQKPSLFVSTWIRVSRAVKENCPLTVMVWAPNSSNGAPFRGTHSPKEGTQFWNEMDTNKDNKWDRNDDPFSPYYPGDEYVDWVGLSLFWYGVNFPFNENLMPPANFTAELLTGTASNTPHYSIYDIYSLQHKKPLAIIETSAPFYSGNSVKGDGVGPIAGKLAWLKQLLGDETRQRFPNLKMVGWFEFKKVEANQNRDFSFTNLTQLVETFRSDIKDLPIVFAKSS